MRWTDLAPRPDLTLAGRLLSFLLLLLPTAVLGSLAYRTGSRQVLAGAGVQALFLVVFLRAHPVWRPPVGASVVVLYLIALAWAWVPLRGSADWAPHLAQGVLLVAAVVLLAANDLSRSGAEALRRATKWARRIAARRRWPAVAECRLVPEAAALRGAVRDDPGPALALLADPRPEVQAAALGALESRTRWRPGEAELVLRAVRESREPAVRAAGAYALGGVSGPDLVAGLAGLLRDPAVEVRRAASEALLWGAEARWPAARDAVKEAMADPRLADDGPLFAGARLPAAAVADLITWSAEHPPLARRAILTVAEHYHADLLAGDRPDVGAELAAMTVGDDTPPALRVELASLLRDHHLLTPDLLDRLTNPDQPAPIRLFAAELMLRLDPRNPDGVDVLRGLARQPNRELAVQVAGVLQGVLGIDLGLPDGSPPAPNSKAAAELTRRVLAWANGSDPARKVASPPASRPSSPGFGPRPPAMPPAAPPNPFLEDSLLDPPPPDPGAEDDGASRLPIDDEPPPRRRPGSSAVI
ncbi:MAG: hypothetical protein C0501_09305 [Isosphaera sp.]|nr:hypothetical protein [Isosphaera sp.]